MSTNVTVLSQNEVLIKQPWLSDNFMRCQLSTFCTLETYFCDKFFKENKSFWFSKT